MSAKLTLSAHNVGIVGAGAVGQAVATALVVSGFCKQLIIASRTLEQATSMAADLDDMRVTLGSPTRPRAVTTARLHDCQLMVIAARARFTNTNATDLRKRDRAYPQRASGRCAVHSAPAAGVGRWSGGTVPPLHPDETRRLEAADVKLHAAYSALAERLPALS